jgi:hypothetical protein
MYGRGSLVTFGKIKTMSTLKPIDFSQDPNEGHRVYIKDGLVHFESWVNYQVPLDRVTNAEQLLSWVHQLCGKGRISNTTIKFFIEAVAAHQKIRIDWNC